MIIFFYFQGVILIKSILLHLFKNWNSKIKGLKLASKKFPEGLITGVLPLSYGLSSAKDVKSTRSIASAISNGSVMSNLSSISKKTFDRYDIEKLNQYLDENLMPNDQTSRLSRAKSSRNSTVGSVSSVKTLTSIHEKPWKPS